MKVEVIVGLLEVADELVDLEGQLNLEKQLKKQSDLSEELIERFHNGILFAERLEAGEDHAGEPIIEDPNVLLLALSEEWQEDLRQGFSDSADHVLLKVPQVGDLADQVYERCEKSYLLDDRHPGFLVLQSLLGSHRVGQSLSEIVLLLLVDDLALAKAGFDKISYNWHHLQLKVLSQIIRLGRVDLMIECLDCFHVGLLIVDFGPSN